MEIGEGSGNKFNYNYSLYDYFEKWLIFFWLIKLDKLDTMLYYF
jgi:hypothetical protein